MIPHTLVLHSIQHISSFKMYLKLLIRFFSPYISPYMKMFKWFCTQLIYTASICTMALVSIAYVALDKQPSSFKSLNIKLQ